MKRLIGFRFRLKTKILAKKTLKAHLKSPIEIRLARISTTIIHYSLLTIHYSFRGEAPETPPAPVRVITPTVTAGFLVRL